MSDLKFYLKLKHIRSFYLVKKGLLVLSNQIEDNNLIKKYEHIFELISFEIERRFEESNGRENYSFNKFLDPFPTELLIDLNQSSFFIFESKINDLYKEKLSEEYKEKQLLWKYDKIKKFLTESCDKKQIKNKLKLEPPLEMKIHSLYKQKSKKLDEQKKIFFNISRVFRNKLSHTNKVYLDVFSEKQKEIIKKYLPIITKTVNGESKEQIGSQSLLKHFCFIRKLLLNLDFILEDLK